MRTLGLSVSNVGGIDTLETTFDPGTNLVAAPNASNKTSLLKAIAFGLGADDVPIRSGSSTAEVTLTIGEKTVTRTAHRRSGGNDLSGTPWLDDEETRAQFTAVAALLEFNGLRTAVRQGGDVGAALKAPIDFAALERRRSDRLQRKQSVRRERETLSDDDRLDRAEAERTAVRERRAALDTRLTALESDRDPTAADEEGEELRTRRTELRTEKRRLEERIDATEDAIERDEAERSTLDDRIGELAARRRHTDVETLREEQRRLQTELESLRDRVDILQSVLTANREMRSSEYASVLGGTHGLAGDEVTCWTCGQRTPVADIEDTLGDLQSLVGTAKERMQSQQPAIDDVEETLTEARRRESELDRLRSERRRLSERIVDRETSLETQSARLTDVEATLEDVTEELTATTRERAETGSEIADAIEATRVERQTLDRELDRLDSTVEACREDAERRNRLDDELDTLTTEIRELTERLETMERQLRTQFNEAMDDVLVALDFDRVQRVWLDGDFDIVVARDVEGTVQQDSVENLAESERELVGLVLGLSGYLAYDLAESVPVLLVDSLGALDDGRIARLVDYFDDVPEFLIAAIHPETADALEGDGVQVLRSQTFRQ